MQSKTERKWVGDARDLAEASNADMKKIALFALAGIFVFVFGFLSGSFWTTLRLSELPILEEIRDARIQGSFSAHSPDTYFWGNRMYGGMVGAPETLKKLPDGEAIFRGRFLFRGQGAEGVKFRLTFNSKYETDLISTDKQGLFSLQMPAGKWYLNSIKCEAWENRPEGSYMLVTGDEKRLGTVSMQELFYDFAGSGKEISLNNDDNVDQLHVDVRIKPEMSLNWPELDIPKQEATVANSEINWLPYPEAQDYVVEISRVTRIGPHSSSLSSVVYNRVSGSEVLRLSELENVKDPAASPQEYSVAVRAYGKEGDFLGASEKFRGSFELTDGHVLVENKEAVSGIRGEATLKKLYRNTKRYQAIELLIKEGMLSEAERLLDRLETDTPEFAGKRNLLAGYLAASRGECAVAAREFEAAAIEGQDCVPEEYRGDCE